MQDVVLLAEQRQTATYKCYYQVWLVPIELVTAELRDGLSNCSTITATKQALKALKLWTGEGDFDDSRQAVIEWAKERGLQQGLTIVETIELPTEDD